MTKVLIIDDEPALRFAVEEALEAHGLEVVAAESAAAALAAIDDVDVVVSDYMMPDLDGMELLGQLRRQSRQSAMQGRRGEAARAFLLRASYSTRARLPQA